ncbi:hypothetical protein C5167_030752 [Papaver somniferum]|uniref:FIP1[V]-like protein n=1 Tax=Papaver somniferum TaxID=3469 RepID=UPI000E6FD17C|nr:FIP1[V]-like protein [Papaver somniferum]RZC89060.1 hypothetical protein C5167_030752 [Papaver somniferum]
MEDIDDDFGDLYADVEVQVSSVIKQVSNSNNHSLYIKEQANNDEEMEDMETDKDLEVMDNGSDDSEDELHILLNEEDCRKYPVVNDSNVRDLGMGSDGEGGDDNDNELVVGTENDRRVAEKFDGGAEQNFAGQSVAERGNGIKSSYAGTQYSPYKYIRPNGTLFPSNNVKSSGAGTAVSFSSAPGSSMALPIVSQGCDFSLPRYMTIFDVNVETFERKPWRYPGVDITNFFNFGLDEESWKDYCNQLEHFRQQATKVPVRGHNQSHGNEYVHESKAVVGDVNSRNANGGVRQLDAPKGRAIQVEGGIGERQPTMDIMRSQDRDSGVVIQIPMQDSNELSPSSFKEEANNSMEDGSDNGGSGLDDCRDGHLAEVTEAYGRSCDVENAGSMRRLSVRPLCSDHDGQRNEILDADGCHLSRVRGCVSEEVTEAKKNTKEAREGVSKDPIKTEACVLEAEPSLNDHILCSLDFDSQSEASEDGDDIEMEDTKNLAKLRSLNSVTRLSGSVVPDFDQQKESRSNESKPRNKYLRPQKDPKNKYLVQEQDKPPSRMKLHSVAELKYDSDVDEASPPSGRKGWCDRNHLTKVHAERKVRKICDDFNVEDMSLYRETEISIGYRGGRVANKHVRSSYSGIIERKVYPHARDEFDPCIRRRYDERDNLLNKRHAGRGNVGERELYLREKGNNNRGIGGINHEEHMQSLPERSSPYRGKERRDHWQITERGGENRFRKEMEIDDFAFEYRYEEEIYQEDYIKHASYEDRERDYIHGKYDRDGPYIAREIERCRQRERYSDGACFDLMKSRDYRGGVDEHWRYSDHESSPPYSRRKSRILKDRSYHEATSPENDLSDSRRSDGRCVDNWRHTHDEKHRDSGWFGPNLNEYKHTDRAMYSDDPVHSDRRRHIWKYNSAMENSTSREQSRGRFHDEEASFYTEMSLRDEYIHVNHDFSRGEMLDDQDRYERDRRIFRREESRDFGISDEAVLRYRNSVDLREESRDLGIYDEQAVLRYRDFSRDEMLNDQDRYERDRRIVIREESRDFGDTDEAVLRYRDSVDLHIVGWKGKLSGRNTKPMAPWINSIRKDIIDHEIDKEQRKYRNPNRQHQGKFVSRHFQKAEINYPGQLNTMTERLGQSHLEHHASKGNEKLIESRPVNHRRDAFSVLAEGRRVEDGHSEIPKERVSTGDAKKKMLDSEDSTKYDNQRILQILAKMEKRRERFKELSTAKKELDINSVPQSDVKLVEAGTEVKQERPARKRRWGGN